MARTQLNLEDKVAGSAERNSGVSWPLAIDRRLDQILSVAADVGERTTRKELVAAILLSFEPDEESLNEVLRRFRKARIADALLDAPDEADGVVTFIPNQAGPRSTRGARDAG